MIAIQELLRDQCLNDLFRLDSGLEVSIGGGVFFSLHVEGGVQLLEIVLNVSLHAEVSNGDWALPVVLFLLAYVGRLLHLPDDGA